MDFVRHNEEVREVWARYNAGDPIRVPMILGINPRIWLLDPKLNREGISFKEYSENAQTMARVQMYAKEYIRTNLPADHEMGLPEGWDLYVDTQNVYEAAWFGCPIVYHEGNCPNTAPMTREQLEKRMADGLPEKENAFFARCLRLHEELSSMVGKEGYRGIPIRSVAPLGAGTDGPVTVACNLMGAAEFLTEMLADPEWADELLEYITEGIICRIKTVREAFGLPVRSETFGVADDSCALLSTPMYEERVLHLHRKLFDTLGVPGMRRGMHLCGDSTRHFPMLKEKLGVMQFDTGYPVQFGKLQKTLGPDVCINGGPSVSLLLGGTAEAVSAEAKRILGEVMPHTKRFILREGNNLAPCTPPENVAAMYETVREFGRY